MNDPNGLIYIDGVYHLFFQYNPFGKEWGNMSWGHAISRDLVNWDELPIAIPFEEGAMAYSGTTVLDKANTAGFGEDTLIAIYTTCEYEYSEAGEFVSLAQYQSLAYSHDEGRTFSKFEGNPILDIGSKDFRDPKVFWYEAGKKWVMLVSLGSSHQIAFFESKTLKEWKRTGTFGPEGDIQKSWECPDLFFLPIEGENEGKWVLTLSAGSFHKTYQGMQYITGEFDGDTFVSDSRDQPQYLDFGKDFYAGISFANLPQVEGVLMLGWVGNFVYGQKLPTDPWRGAMSLPRKLSLKRVDGKLLLVQQVEERILSSFSQIEWTFPAYLEDEIVSKSLASSCFLVELAFTNSTAKSFGVKLFLSSEQETVLQYDVQDELFYLDRSRSGLADFSPKFTTRDSFPFSLKEEQLYLQIIADKSILEVFLNHGERVMTQWIFPRSKGQDLALFSYGGKVDIDSCIIKTYEGGVT